jgi:Mor family transcriptional regulator
MRACTSWKEVGYSSIYDVNTKQIAQQGNESTRKRLELHLAQIQMQDLGGINNNLDLFLHPRL